MIRPLLVSLLLLSTPLVTLAQVIPDSTLGTNSSQQTSGLVINGVPSGRIDGGLTHGTSLFHSFREFNVGTGRGVYFASPTGIGTIFTRVTGANPSTINGTLGVIGQANLIFINPNGIQFGSEARLDLRGSFLASTAKSIQFPNGEFSATNPQTPPLLTVAAPIGLIFDGETKPISVQGGGYAFNIEDPQSQSAGQNAPGLHVDPGRSLTLIGGPVNLTGGVLIAPSGRIEVGAIDRGVVTVQPDVQGWNFDYMGVAQFAPVDLTKLSLIDATGPLAGKINIQAQSLSLSDGSFVTLLNQGAGAGGIIQATVQDRLDITGTTDALIERPISFDNYYRAGFATNTLFGTGADISIRTKLLSMNQGAGVRTATSASGSAGTIRVDATDQIDIKRSSLRGPLISPSSIQSATFGAGRAGNITISTPELNLSEGGAVFNVNSSNSSGNTGDIVINTQRTRIEGVASPFTASVISTGSIGTGNAGNILLNTDRLDVLNGGQLTSIASGAGDSGDISIRASEIILRGRNPILTTPSAVGTSIVLLEPTVRPIFNVSGTPIGRGGTLRIQSEKISISDSAQLRVINEGIGDGGNLQVQTNRLALTNGGSITAATQTGQGGNILLSIGKALNLSNSEISASSRTSGQGGNISIESGVFAALRQSSISANAADGRGGKIAINSKGVFIAPDSRITATSALGRTFDGTVQINTIESGVNRTAIRQPAAPSTMSVQAICPTQSDPNVSQFINNGTGGIPLSSSTPLTDSAGWMPRNITLADPTVRSLTTRTKSPIVEFRSWRFSPDKKTVELIASPGAADVAQSNTSPCQLSSTSAKP